MPLIRPILADIIQTRILVSDLHKMTKFTSIFSTYFDPITLVPKIDTATPKPAF